MYSRTLLVILGVMLVLVGLGVIFVPRFLEKDAKQVSWPTQAWPASTPEENGLDSDKLAEGLQAIEAQGTKIDSLMAIRDGAVLVEASFYPYDSAYLHDLASVTKSFMTTLIGIAVDQGKLELDQPVLSFFPERTIANRDERKERMTVRDLVSMRNGFESGCQEGDLPTVWAMQSQPDWVQAALDRKMAVEPGTAFCYDSPGMHLLSAILQKTTGMTALEFARQNLFEPLGIQEAYWMTDPQGTTRGWGDLHLKPGDAAKLGYLWLNGGEWEGEQIVSARWVKDSVDYHSDFGDGGGYGYGWWLWEGGYEASGRGGQHIKVLPAYNILVVTTGGGFDYDAEVDRYLVGAVVDFEEAQTANPAGEAALKKVVSQLAVPDSPQLVPPLPETAEAISGKTYLFEPNLANIESLEMTFDSSSEATLQLKYHGSEAISVPVGLDGIFRPGVEGDLKRGRWADPQTFILEIFDVGLLAYPIHFDGERLIFEAPAQGLTFYGRSE